MSKTDPAPAATQPATQSPEPTPPLSASHSDKSHASKTSVCDTSPFICRRLLDAQTDQELRLACRAILHNFKPSDQGMVDTDPKLDFGAMQRRTGSKPQSSQVKVRMPTGAPPDLHKATSLRRSKTRTRTKADLEIKARGQQGTDVPVRANSSRKRADFAWLDERDGKREEKLKMHGKASMDMPRPAMPYNDSNEEITLPVTVTSTLAHSKLPSTAPTSASLLSRGNSKGGSHQGDTLDDASPSQTAAARPPRRSASIKENLRGYVFTGTRSRALSRAQSKESLRSPEGDEDQELDRSSSWRKWSFPRRSSSKGRPGTANGSEKDPLHKAESGQVDLNRDLPPLPGLDQWKEPKQAEVKMPRSPIAATHIASMMRTPEQNPECTSPSSETNNRGNKLAILTTQNADVFPPRGSSRNAQAIPLSPQRAPPPIPDIPTMSTSSSHTRHRSGDSMPTTIGTASAEAAYFSRKMSVDSSLGTMSKESKPTKKDEQKSRLKKVFSGWMMRKEKKQADWTHSLEKETVKDGVLLQEGSAPNPMVRY